MTEADVRRRSATRSDRRVNGGDVVALVALGAMTVGVVSALTQTWTPVSDLALIELHVRDVPGHLPLVGAYSRVGWSHPGPAQYLLLALPYRLFGGASWSIPVATVVINIVAVAAAWRVARSLDELAGRFVLLGALILIASGDPSVLRNWWNPYLGVVLTMTLIVLAWATAERRFLPTVALVPVASVLVQSHVGYVAVAVPTVATGLLLALLPRHAETQQRRSPWTAMAIGLLVTALLWLPAGIQQVTGHPGNLSELFRAGAGTGDPIGLGGSLRLLSENLAVPPPWAGGSVRTAIGALAPVWSVPVLALIPVAAIWLAVGRRSALHLRALGVAVAGTAGAVVGVASIHGPLFPYLVPWFAATVAMLLALSCWTVVSMWPSHLVERYTPTLLSAVTVAVAVVIAVQQVPAAHADPGKEIAVTSLSSALIDDADGHDVFVGSAGEFGTAAVFSGVVLEAERAGLDVRVPEFVAREFAEHRTGSVEDRDEYLVAPARDVSELVSDGWELVALHDPFTADEGRRLSALDTRRRQLERRTDTAAGRELIDVVQEIAAIERTRIACVLVRR